jgi:hypothetical protein
VSTDKICVKALNTHLRSISDGLQCSSGVFQYAPYSALNTSII